jgi:hypothetical protein
MVADFLALRLFRRKKNGYFVEIASKLDLLIQDESDLLTWLIVLAVVDLV